MNVYIKNSRVVAFFCLLLLFCTVNIFAGRYYRLLEHERKIYLGLRVIDSVAADKYLNLDAATERAKFYRSFWSGRSTDERTEFEERVDYAYRNFGRFSPLSDDRIPIYVKYGPAKKDIIIPEKKVGVTSNVEVKPAEIWTYRKEGFIFDFVRIGRAYKLIAQSEFGEKIKVLHLNEIAADTSIEIEPTGQLDFNIGYGRFRQKKNLTRLEIYITLDIEDTTELSFSRQIKIFDKNDSLINQCSHILIPQEGARGIFLDEVNLWLRPEQYRVEIELIDIKNALANKKELSANLVEYENDTKEISDLIPARLIDKAFTHEKFEKPVGRVIPLIASRLPVHKPFYFYAEIYNLETQDGMYRIRTTYEIYNKEKMRKEIVDVMIRDWIEPGNVAYLGAEYHPMDLSPGNYIIVLRVKDLLSGKEKTAVTEFGLEPF